MSLPCELICRSPVIGAAMYTTTLPDGDGRSIVVHPPVRTNEALLPVACEKSTTTNFRPGLRVSGMAMLEVPSVQRDPENWIVELLTTAGPATPSGPTAQAPSRDVVVVTSRQPRLGSNGATMS